VKVTSRDPCARYPLPYATAGASGCRERLFPLVYADV
jgi:hypothetical protein